MTLINTDARAIRRSCATCLGVFGVGLAASVLLPAATSAQVVSEGRGTLTMMVGQGSSPVGGVATEVADQTFVPKITQHSIGWRVMGGYNFADFLSFEAGVARVGYAKSSAPYVPVAGVQDQVNAKTALNVIEANLVARAPLARGFRLDFTLGLAETSLDTSLSTQLGSALPSGQSNPVHARHFGYDAGVDAEWMISDHLSAVVGYHAYPQAGSTSTIGSTRGTFSLLGAGIHMEF